MNNMNERIEKLEDNIKGLKKELRRLKSAINRLEKLELIIPNEVLVKKDIIENVLKENKQELKALKKVAELIK